ncbi:vomeronasal type-2 receptor 26-like [Engystomops pustulosus]|uniref:vomeronasal type-2 receptor 26-like n=1 Tax=Engystomops pustulosus TaxID=76066 RepID=UPI003AFA1E34
MWPDEKKMLCFLKILEFLSYEKDILLYIFLTLTLLLCVITLFILGSFIYYWDTPIVRANNRTVSFILLVSIFLSFLCVFFFLGRPVGITCLLRQVSFGIFFTIGVSSILAKTITVCIAFKATKPGSSWKKFVSFKVSNSVVLVCSSVQVLICVIWLLVSPPYVEYNHHTYPGKIIIQCNEGSDICFYSMLGYMGLLAAVSFVLAFMVRTLPDSFNEAKYITFSMLLFCSVWIAMIPAYLSTRGKYMVAVEGLQVLQNIQKQLQRRRRNCEKSEDQENRSLCNNLVITSEKILYISDVTPNTMEQYEAQRLRAEDDQERQESTEGPVMVKHLDAVE